MLRPRGSAGWEGKQCLEQLRGLDKRKTSKDLASIPSFNILPQTCHFMGQGSNLCCFSSFHIMSCTKPRSCKTHFWQQKQAGTPPPTPINLTFIFQLHARPTVSTLYYSPRKSRNVKIGFVIVVLFLNERNGRLQCKMLPFLKAQCSMHCRRPGWVVSKSPSGFVIPTFRSQVSFKTSFLPPSEQNPQY